MKVSIFSTFYPFRGGIAQFSACLYRALEEDHEVRAYTFKRQYPDFLFPGETQFVTEKDKVDKIEALRVLDSMNPFTWFSAGRKIKKQNPNLFISNYWMTFFGPSLGLLSSSVGSKSKKIAILHNVVPHEKRFFDSFFNRLFLERHDGFVVMSDAVLNDLLTIKPNAKFIRIDHPVYNHFGVKPSVVSARERLNISLDKKVILFFGFIRAYKGLDVLLKAMTDLDDSYHLIVAGEVYGEFDSYQEIIEKNGIQNKVSLFNQYIDDEEVPLYFAAADVCVLPYKSATQSGITAISFHFDLPVIATDVGGLKETVKHLETGLIVPEAKENLVSEAIQYYFDESKKESYSKQIELEKKSHSWTNFADKLIQFSKSLD
jgi:glycosyltransferase involved in cell wall biosynthesis